ncbi:helix-turn-helix transcriptional regulator [Streptomyces sp. MS06]|uniref:helix-turn-helix transcriptional regulator n=1 Tax=Streptomyces sp. MS06 TaxID=3385974 RepID=UPI00399F839E
MPTSHRGPDPAVGPPLIPLLGRRTEREALDGALKSARAGESRALVIRGEPGVGKSTLLDHLVRQASDCRVVTVSGVQSEMELAFAAVHQLCAPMLDLLDRLPGPQRDALGTAFGLRSGPPPDRFLLSLAVLGLIAAAAEEKPLVCVIDDAQWLDRVSAQVLAFVARRLTAEPVVCVFAVRDADDGPGDGAQAWGLPEIRLGGLDDEDARKLLRTAIPGPLDERVCERIVAEARGNPLALLELPRGLTHAELAGGFGLPAPQALSGRIEDSFRRQLERLPSDTRQLLLLAAAEPLGDPVLVWRAAARLGIGAGALAAAAAARLIQFGTRIRFRHPLVRSAVYRAASAKERMCAHEALAEATDAEALPEQRAWHRAHAAAAPDEEVAAELELSAGHAQARGGLAAAAAFMHRAVMLTPESARRAERALTAAHAEQKAGAAEAARELLAVAEAGPLDERQHARAGLLRAEIAFTAHHGNLAPPLLLDAAKRLESLDARLARETYLQTLSAAMFAGRLAHGCGLLEIAAAARAAPPAPGSPGAADLLLEALSRYLTENSVAAAPAMNRAVNAFLGDGVCAEEELRWLWLAYITAVARWDGDAWRALAERHVRLARTTGALSVLPLALSSRIIVHLFEGELPEAAALSTEVSTITAVTGMQITDYGALTLAAWRGREAEAEELGRRAVSEARKRGEGVGLTVAQWATAVLRNGQGRYQEARTAAAQASADPPAPGVAAHWAPAELVEAAVRCGDAELASQALEQLMESTGASRTDWARGIEARSRALAEPGGDTEALYREAIDRLGATRLRPESARTHLLYGEWLRRERRRVDAREHLRRAHDVFTTLGMAAFAERAARELRATGESVRRRSVEAGGDLTPRELQIARLVGEGLTNPEIGSRLFMSPRTVEYHLRKVFAKRGIASRTEIRTVLGDDL